MVEEYLLDESHRADFKHEELPLLDGKGDIVLVHDHHNYCHSNVPRYADLHSTHHTWGYAGNGPHAFAFDIVYHFTKDYDFSCKYYQDLIPEILMKYEFKSDHVIDQEIIEKFISDKKAANKGGANDK